MENHEGRLGMDDVAVIKFGIGGGALADVEVELDAGFDEMLPFFVNGEGVSAVVKADRLHVVGVFRKFKFKCIALLSLLGSILVIRIGVCKTSSPTSLVIYIIYILMIK